MRERWTPTQAEKISLVIALVRLRRQGKIPCLWIDADVIRLAAQRGPLPPECSRRVISWAATARLIQAFSKKTS